jgi:hypothetical protein
MKPFNKLGAILLLSALLASTALAGDITGKAAARGDITGKTSGAQVAGDITGKSTSTVFGLLELFIKGDITGLWAAIS